MIERTVQLDLALESAVELREGRRRIGEPVKARRQLERESTAARLKIGQTAVQQSGNVGEHLRLADKRSELVAKRTIDVDRHSQRVTRLENAVHVDCLERIHEAPGCRLLLLRKLRCRCAWQQREDSVRGAHATGKSRAPVA